MPYEHLWRNEYFREAFQRWWDEDWSWAGLGVKKVSESLGDIERRPSRATAEESVCSLQDTWREEESQLIEFGDRKWTRFHLPPFDRNGSICPQALWARAKDQTCVRDLNNILCGVDSLSGRVRGETYLSAIHQFAELRGVVFSEPLLEKCETLVANVQSAIFLEGVYFTNLIFANWEKSIFGGMAWFHEAVFPVATQFRSVTFCDAAFFHGATFRGAAGFEKVTCVGDAQFLMTYFSDEVSFKDAEFNSNMSADLAMFEKGARCNSATFAGYASFNGTTFSGSANFEGAKFAGHVEFTGATFSGNAKFGSTTFSDDARFACAIFYDDVDISGTLSFAGKMSFAGATFRRDVNFSGREFTKRTSFLECRFSGVPRFYNAKLHSDTSFLNARFSGDGQSLPPLRLHWFRPEAPREDVEELKRWRTEARVRLVRWMRGRRRISAKWWRDHSRRPMRLGGLPFALQWDTQLASVRRKRDSDAEEYEIAYRQLRRLCAEVGSIEYEGRFHALELKAHRARTDTQIPARLASWFYEKFSDYGRSISRPLVWLAWFWGLFTIVYALAFMPPYLVGGAGMSERACRVAAPDGKADVFVTVAREFLPSLFGTSSTTSRPDWLRCAEGAHPLLFFFTSALQIVVFIACVSLFLIAMRRRFQLRD